MYNIEHVLSFLGPGVAPGPRAPPAHGLDLAVALHLARRDAPAVLPSPTTVPAPAVSPPLAATPPPTPNRRSRPNGPPRRASPPHLLPRCRPRDPPGPDPALFPAPSLALALLPLTASVKSLVTSTNQQQGQPI